MSSSKPRKFGFFKKLCIFVLVFSLIGGAIGVAGLYGYYLYMAPKLPDTSGLKDLKLQIPLSIYSQDGQLIAQYGEKKRTPIIIGETPEQLIQAFIAAEDDRFFSHPGVDYKGLLRAAIGYARTGEKRQGGSTITMQVARNFFLTRDKTFIRKIKEIFLAFEIEAQFNKLEILELYLNKIYLGHRAYGIGAAAQIYYGTDVHHLDLAQWAMIAGLPKAPSNFNPLTNPSRALTRRDYVLRRMYALEFITLDDYKRATNRPVTAKLHAYTIQLNAPYVAEMVRDKIVKRFGTEAYVGGFKVYTSIDSRLQNAARNALRNGLHSYDERHGYRGVLSHLILPPNVSNDWLDSQLEKYSNIGDTIPAITTSINDRSIDIYLGNDEFIEVPWDGLKWARTYKSENSRGRNPKSAHEIVSVGDIIRVRKSKDKGVILAQVPSVEGALVSINPIDGSILALTGGYDFFQSKYNRASQAKRQPGSGFKPILYTKALEEGFTAASIINDAPIVLQDSYNPTWRPKNYSGKFYGPTRLRVALRKSRNLVSIRLLRQIGIQKVAESAMRFGLPSDQIPRSLSMALGSGSAAPLEMARVYAVFANGGFLIDPYLILRIESSNGKIIEESLPRIACPQCGELGEKSDLFAPRVVSEEVNYLMTSLLQDVVRRGTAAKANKLGRSDIAGKTGTTNEQRDAWFNGFSPTLATVVWVGFDSSKPLGSRETGGKAALPIWIEYTAEALKNTPIQKIPQPTEIISAQINRHSGHLASPNDPNAIPEIFRSGHEPIIGESIDNGLNPYLSDESENTQIQSLF